MSPPVISPVLWYAARAAGMVAWGLLAASTLLGLVIATRALPLRSGLGWATDLHRGLGALAVVFVAVHVTAIVVDGYVRFSVLAALVPLVSRWHPVWVAWGVVALWLLVAVETTSLARRWLAPQVWRRIHVLSLPLFALATVHGLAAGTDSGNPAVYVIAATAAMTVAFLTAASAVGARGTPAGEHGAGRRPA